jgi:hypothetical protein
MAQPHSLSPKQSEWLGQARRGFPPIAAAGRSAPRSAADWISPAAPQRAIAHASVSACGGSGSFPPLRQGTQELQLWECDWRRTINLWLSRIDKDAKEASNRRIFDAWMACRTQDEIAAVETCGSNRNARPTAINLPRDNAP